MKPLALSKTDPVSVDVNENVPPSLKRLRRLANLLDTAVPVPVIGFRVGLDGILGLIPVVGDLVALGMGVTTIHCARDLGAPKRLQARMLLNLAIDATIGSIPLVGDIFDFIYKANAKNLALLETWYRRQPASMGTSKRR